LIITFGSIKYAFLPLTTIIFGVLWAFGFIGMMGLKMSSATSGIISMIMGIGIDFGIQIIARFRQELNDSGSAKTFEEFDGKIESSMKQSMNVVLMPMLTTTLAAVLGFKAMSMGQLTVMKEMGDMMTYGVVFCFLAAITFVPAITIVVERISYKMKKSFKKFHSEFELKNKETKIQNADDKKNNAQKTDAQKKNAKKRI
jgi:predicted RND superfamily exporter protein